MIAIISSSLELPWEEDMFRDSTFRPIVLTTPKATPARLDEARTHAEVVTLPGGPDDLAHALEALAERGLRRVVCEGGLSLLTGMAAAGLIDEADISLSPLCVGGPARNNPGLTPVAFRLHHVIAADDFLFARYLSAIGPSAGASR